MKISPVIKSSTYEIRHSMTKAINFMNLKCFWKLIKALTVTTHLVK